jgi:hypothetical protein
MTKYLVGDEHTLVYQQEGTNRLGVLHGSILRGSPYGGPLQGPVPAFMFKVLRPATLQDFEDYRVMPPKDFTGGTPQ